MRRILWGTVSSYCLLLFLLPVMAISSPLILREIIQEQSSVSTHGDAVTVFIYGDPQIFNPFMLGAEVKRLEEDFKLPVLAYEAESVDRLVVILQFFTEQQILIQNLVVRGIHGGNIAGVPFFDVVDVKKSEFDIFDMQMLKEKNIHLNFSPSAFVFFDSCNLVDDQSVEVIRKAFLEIEKIGFSSGWVYLNDTDGASAFESTFKVPFWRSYGGFKKKARHFLFQVLGWPIIAPLFYYKDRFEFNQGYLRGVSKNHEVILKTYSGHVENGEVAGEWIYSH